MKESPTEVLVGLLNFQYELDLHRCALTRQSAHTLPDSTQTPSGTLPNRSCTSCRQTSSAPEPSFHPPAFHTQDRSSWRYLSEKCYVLPAIVDAPPQTSARVVPVAAL